jgi:hypothetical protein
LEAFAAGRGALGLGDQKRVGVDFLFPGQRDFIGSEIVSEPLEGSAGGEHAPEDAPFSGDGMAHGVDAAEGVARWLVAVCEDDAAGAEGGGDDSAGDDAVADSAGALIPSTADDGRSGHEAQFFGGFVGEHAGDFGGFVNARQKSGVDFQYLQKALGPLAVDDVEEEGAAGVADFGGVFAG